MRASAGFALTSLQAEAPSHQGGIYIETTAGAHQSTVGLLELISRWNEPCAIEMHLLSHPSLDSTRRGRIQIAVRLHTLGKDRAEALEMCLARSLLLENLLKTHWEQADFQPIT